MLAEQEAEKNWTFSRVSKWREDYRAQYDILRARAEELGLEWAR